MYKLKFTKNTRQTICFSILAIVIYCGCLAESNIIIPVLLAITAHSALIILFLFLYYTLNIKLSNYEKKIIFACIFIIILIYVLIVSRRNFIYYWDYSNYYGIQNNYHNACQTSFIDAFYYIINSIWNDSYTCFINIFTEVPYIFGDHSIDSYVISVIVNIIPYLVFAVVLFLKTLKLDKTIENNKLFFLLSILLLIPLTHRAILWGQPDAFGLIFLFGIMAVSNQYDFEKMCWKKNVLLFVMTILLMVTRRWYMYWIVGYYFSFFGIKILRLLFSRKFETLKKVLLHILAFGSISGILGGLILGPMLKNILFYDYSDRYSSYLIGGFTGEIENQITYLGFLILIPIFAGMLIGLISQKHRELTLQAITTFFIAIILFTRVQNMHYHQALILLPSYFMLLVPLACIILDKTKRTKLFEGIAILILVFNFIVSYGGEESFLYKHNIVSKVYMKVPDRKDYTQVLEVTNWILDNCNTRHEAYIIPHGRLYNPDIFRNVSGADIKRMHTLVPYGSAIFGTHNFPSGLFTSKYVLTTVPFNEGDCSKGLAIKYNDCFQYMVKQGVFQEINSFDMGNGYHFIVYQRIKDVSNEEINYYETAFVNENEKYPEMFSGIWNQYKN